MLVRSRVRNPNRRVSGLAKDRPISDNRLYSRGNGDRTGPSGGLDVSVVPMVIDMMQPTPDIPEGADRRNFFRQAARKLVTPLASYLDRTTGAMPAGSGYLRPPGAVDEAGFASVCQRCGACVSSCPADAIFALDESYGIAAGTPVIDADRAACVVCDGLVCTTGCPSGALTEILDAAQIRMGTAEVYGGLCVRTAGESCTLCVDRCPLGEQAIRFVTSGPPEVLAAGCVGCGVCQVSCPTTPKAIVVAARETVAAGGLEAS